MLSFRTPPQPRYLVENPIIFHLETDSTSPVQLEIQFPPYGPYGVTYYHGIYTPSGKSGDLRVDISVNDIIKTFMTGRIHIEQTGLIVESNFSYSTIYIRFNQGGNMIETNIIVYPGGISNQFIRYLTEKNTNIFTYKLLNTYKQFLLTTRTAGRHLFLRENEVCPLYFIATNKNYTVETEHGTTYPAPAMTPGNIYALDLDFIRKSEMVQNRLTQYFNVKVNGNVLFDITIIPSAPVPNIYVIEFINSYGVPERLEISGRKTSAPELKSDETFDRYDPDIDNYIEQNDRVQLREIINASFGYKTIEELFFARDMLQSAKRYLIDSAGFLSEVRINSEAYEHSLHPVTPGSVPLTINFVDTETQFSPIPDESLPEGGIRFTVTIHGNGGETSAGESTVILEVQQFTEWKDIVKPAFNHLTFNIPTGTGLAHHDFVFVKGDYLTSIPPDYVIENDIDVWALYKVVFSESGVYGIDVMTGKTVYFNQKPFSPATPHGTLLFAGEDSFGNYTALEFGSQTAPFYPRRIRYVKPDQSIIIIAEGNVNTQWFMDEIQLEEFIVTNCTGYFHGGVGNPDPSYGYFQAFMDSWFYM